MLCQCQGYLCSITVPICFQTHLLCVHRYWIVYLMTKCSWTVHQIDVGFICEQLEDCLLASWTPVTPTTWLQIVSYCVLHLKVCSASAFHNIKQWWKIWENRGPSHPPHLQVCPNSGHGLEGMQLPLVPQSVKKGLEGHWIVQSTSYKTTGPWCPEMQEKLTQEIR